eukprot:TRINITY_DN11830_c0_g1_i1.p2 TRINITY_DN11830_c0_g1~~TRINITY_DN11830_c0_g1_i1.p2  ORF type:complete len:331 (-),score=123.11 TRINITY_DN11830_c0_g1_i1:10-1002(-)
MAEDTFKKPVFKKRTRNANVVQKASDYSVLADESASAVVPVAKAARKTGVAQPEGTSVAKGAGLFTFESTGSQVSRGDQLATSTVESETEFDRDATAIENRRRADAAASKLPKVLSGDDAENAADGAYKGMAGYKDWIEKRDPTGSVKGTGIRAGPIRAPTNLRVSVRFDYQPDLCKDYKETGYCGFGDSCKFMHDRGDYQTGWQLERDWSAQQSNKSQPDEDYTVDPDEDFPYACSICRKPFNDPVVTKCKHYFCEACALSSFKKTMKCQICGENTLGSFSMCSKLIKDKMKARLAAAIARGDVDADGDDAADTEGADAPEQPDDDDDS